MHVVVSERPNLPFAKRVKCHWDRDRQVDANPAYQDLVGELTCRIAITDEDRGAVTILILIDQASRCLVIGRPRHSQDRAKDLFLIDRHLRANTVKQAASNEVTILITLEGKVTTVEKKVDALCDAGIDLAAELFEVLLRHEWFHLRIGIGARSDF